jgi:hypothetical protein
VDEDAFCIWSSSPLSLTIAHLPFRFVACLAAGPTAMHYSSTMRVCPARVRALANHASDNLKENLMRAKRLTTQQRQEIFHALVITQDSRLMSIPESIVHVSKQFDITEAQMRQIQDEGIEKEWPPLNEAVQTVN